MTKPDPAYDAYVICTAPRSGSTLLCRMLAATGVAGNPNSHFHEPSLSDWCRDYGVQDQAGRPERAILREVFDAARVRGRGGTPVFGLRLQARSLAFFEEKLAVLHPDEADTRARFQAAFGRTVFIRLQRRDVVDQAISFVKAKQTGLWHRSSDGTELERLAPPAPPRYDYLQIDTARREFECFNVAWQAWFSALGVAPLTKTYDELSVDPRGVLGRVLSELGFDAALAFGIAPPVARLSDSTNAEWKARYAADRLTQAS